MKRLLPLLLLYLAIIAGFWRWNLVDDERRYVHYASNLVAGHYAEPGMRIWNGPGYPLVLVPFVALSIPPRFAVLLNAVFIFGAVLLVRATARQFMSARGALALALAMGLYPPFYAEMISLLTEPLSVLLVSALACCVVLSFRRDSLLFAAAAGLCLGYLALTKVFYGYVAAAGLLLAGILAIRLGAARRMLLTCAVALAACAPYLAYTQAVTGRFFYWGNSGGMSMYWMSTPDATEYGDWNSPSEVSADAEFIEHRDLFRELETMDYVARDDTLRRRAIANMAANPGKAVFNWAMNMSRLWFCYPNTNKLQRPHTLGYMVFNAALLAALALCVYPMWRARRRILPEIWVILVFAVIALGGSSLLSAVPRMLNPVVPALFVIIGYTFGQLVEVRLRKDGTDRECVGV